MITLDVAFDDDLVTDCLTGAGALSAATWQRFCQSRGVPLLGESPDAFLSDRVLTRRNSARSSILSEFIWRPLSHAPTAWMRCGTFGVDAEVFFELYAVSASNDLHPLSDAIVRETPATQRY